MHSVFAVEPEAINNWADFRYITEKFGYSKGLLISRYPKNWMKRVIDAARANNVPDVEQLRIVERLNQIKNDRLFKSGLSFNGGSWLENATRDEICASFDGLILKEPTGKNKQYSVVDADEAIFENRREWRVYRNAGAIANTAARVIADSNYLILIDPYFHARSRCTKVLLELLDIVSNSAKTGCSIEIHVAGSKSQDTIELAKEKYSRALGTFKDKGITIHVTQWSDDAVDFDIHARYLITDKGGLRIDRGFDEPVDHQDRAKTTEVTCMEPSAIDLVLNDYDISVNEHFIKERFQILP